MKTEELQQLVEAYQSLVFTICNRMCGDYFEAENLAQETFLTYFDKYAGKNTENPKSLLCTIAANKCRDYLKSARYRRSMPTAPESMLDYAASDDPAGAVADADILQHVAALCSELDEPYRSVATDYYIRDMTMDEIEQKTKVNRKTLQTRLYRARNKLRVMWKEEMARERT